MTMRAQMADGRVLEFPDGTDPAVIGRTVKSLLGKADSPAPAPDLDTETGAPVAVRAAVGAAVSPQDRLATLRKSFPDAQPHGDDNFVYSDPTTHRPTLYNEENDKIFGVSVPSLGDIASLAPELGEFAGGMIGGGVAAAGAPATGGASLLTIPMAVGGGALAGREAVRGLAQRYMGSAETRPVGEQLSDFATTFGTNAVAGPVGEKIGQGLKAFTGPVTRYIGGRLRNANVMDAFNQTGVAPQAGAVTGNRLLQQAEQFFFNTPGGAGVMQRSFDQTKSDVTKEATDLAERLGSGARTRPPQPVQSTEGAGATLKEGARRAGERFATEREALDTTAVNLIGATRPTPLTKTQAVLTDLQTQLARAPTSQPELQRAIAEAQRMVDDAASAGGDLPFDVIRKIRTRLGRELDQPDVAGYRPGEDAHMARLYGALREDLYGAAKTAGPNAERALKAHDDYVTMFRGSAGGRVPPAKTLQKVQDAGTDAAAMRYAMEGAQDSTQRLAQLRSQVTPEEWDVISASVFHNLGRAKPSGQSASMLGEIADDFSIDTFLTNWSKLQQSGSSNVLFGGSRYAPLQGPIDNLVKVIGSLKDSASMRNFSGTGRQVAWGSAASALGAVAGATLGGDTSSAGTGALGTLLALTVGSYGGARLLTSPRFVRWLAGTATRVASNPNSLTQQLGRLTGIAKAEPYLRENIDRIMAGLQQPAPAGGGA